MIYQRKYGVASSGGTRVFRPLVKRGAVDHALGADWTPVAGDVVVSKDGGAFANIATLPTALAAGNGAVWIFSFSAAELQCKTLQVAIVDAATKAIEDDGFTVETFGDPAAMYPADVTADNSDAEARLRAALKGSPFGTVGTGSTTTAVVASAINPTHSTLDQFKGRQLTFASDTATVALRGQSTRINTCTVLGTLVVDVLSTAPAAGDTFSIT